jgi:hypothetical protein
MLFGSRYAQKTAIITGELWLFLTCKKFIDCNVAFDAAFAYATQGIK